MELTKELTKEQYEQLRKTGEARDANGHLVAIVPRGQVVSKDEYPELYEVVKEMAKRGGAGKW